MTWRAWSALCALAGVVLVPLVVEVVASGSPIRFVALPLRWAWAWVVVAPLLKEGWVRPATASAAFAGLAGGLAGMVLLDLAGLLTLPLGWFLALEAWQRPLYPWLDLLPRWAAADRPGYLWLAAVWTLAEAAAAAVSARRLAPLTPGPLRTASRCSPRGSP